MSTALSDVASSAFVAAAVYPDAKSATVTGSAVDMISADGACFAVQQVGEFDADLLEGVIQESATGSSGWAAITGAEFADVTAANRVQAITFTRTARYLRYVGTVTGDTPSIEMAVLIGEQRKSL